ncbi:GNAT family N-acetyltransferase [Alkaliphilus crotonatoxidans]
MTIIKKVTSGKKGYMELLLLADPDERMIDRYLQQGDLYVMFAGEQPVCVAVVLSLSSDLCELKNIATAEAFQYRGYATGMLNYLFDIYKKAYSFMQVGTSEAMIGFYSKQGFLYSHRIKNFFVDHYPEPIFENGIQCVDMTYLKKKL